MDILGYPLTAAAGLCLLGFVVGAFGTMIGAGGGFLLAPALLLLYPHERPETVTAISLAVVFCNAASGSVAYARLRRIEYRSGLIFAAVSVPGALLGAYTTNFLPRRAFDLLFGALLLALGAFVVAGARRSVAAAPEGTVPAAKGAVQARLTDRSGETYAWTYPMGTGVGLSVGVGFVSSLLGIGGGIIHVPALARLLRFPVPIATATSHFILALVALVGTVVHVATGAFVHGSRRAALLSVGVVLGAQLGARLSHHIHGGWILRSLGAALCLVGVRLLLIR